MMGRVLPRVAALAVALVVWIAPRAASAVPTHLVAGFGSSLAASGNPGDGGPSLSLATMWSFDPGFEAGVMVFVDDIGNAVTTLIDANDPTLVLGSALEVQRQSFGVAWRVDAQRRGTPWVPYASATIGYYRVQRDRLGVVTSAESANGASLGVGLRRLLGEGAALGLSVRYHQLSSNDLDHYMQMTLDGSVRWGQ